MMTFTRSNLPDTFLFEGNFFSLGGEMKKRNIKRNVVFTIKSHKKNDPEESGPL